MTLDVIDIHRLIDSRLLIKIQHVALKVRVIDDAPQIAFEMAVINDVETNERAKQSPIRFDDSLAEQIATISEALFHFVERVEKSFAGAFVDLLPRGETGAINAVVDVLVEKIIELGVLGFEIFREKIDVLVRREFVKDEIEHRANVVLAIVHDLFRFLVPKHGNGDAIVEIWIGRAISFAQITKAIDRIGRFEVIELFQIRTGL